MTSSGSTAMKQLRCRSVEATGAKAPTYAELINSSDYFALSDRYITRFCLKARSFQLFVKRKRGIGAGRLPQKLPPALPVQVQRHAGWLLYD